MCEGEDEEEALKAIVEAIEDGLGSRDIFSKLKEKILSKI